MSNTSDLTFLGNSPVDKTPLIRVSLNLMREHDWLTVLEFGRVDDGQDGAQWAALEDENGWVGLLFDRPADEPDAVGQGPLFHCPQLGLERASIAEIAIATDRLFPNYSTPNRQLFNDAAGMIDDPQTAVDLWLTCLATGDCMAHFGVGTTFLELGQPHDAYRHLRYYATIAPADPWTQCWYGKAAEAIGEFEEAISAYDAAIALEQLPAHADSPSDAAELREDLLQRLAEDA
ncbi:MAG: hypothetical protein NTX07_05555 [Solirubrobacterales bacterium]|nr:hypothetical protein [Solirubrobacterales bacterium]